MASRRWPRRLRRKVLRLTSIQPAAVSAWKELAATLSRRELQSTGPLASMPSRRGRMKDASDDLKVRLALLDCAVGLGGCNAELVASAYPLGFVGEPGRCSGRFAQCLVRQEAVSHLPVRCRAPAIA
eukprot:2826523-Pleurochrysis_carterae.AAC.1